MLYSNWMVQVWEEGQGFTDYWPITVKNVSRRNAVKRAPKVFCGDYQKRYQEGKLRWRVERCLDVCTLPWLDDFPED